MEKRKIKVFGRVFEIIFTVGFAVIIYVGYLMGPEKLINGFAYLRGLLEEQETQDGFNYLAVAVLILLPIVLVAVFAIVSQIVFRGRDNEGNGVGCMCALLHPFICVPYYFFESGSYRAYINNGSASFSWFYPYVIGMYIMSMIIVVGMIYSDDIGGGGGGVYPNNSVGGCM